MAKTDFLTLLAPPCPERELIIAEFVFILMEEILMQDFIVWPNNGPYLCSNDQQTVAVLCCANFVKMIRGFHLGFKYISYLMSSHSFPSVKEFKMPQWKFCTKNVFQF